ncbi:MAG TPA: AAA family ATPase [Allosphingosinicella sp.]
MYTDHYGLSGPAFQLTPDARFWFESRTHKKAMAYLGYGLAQGEGFIAITGEIGAGKSTLVAHLMARIDRARLNAIHIVSTQVEGDDMLRLIARGLGIAAEGTSKAGLIERVEQRLDEEYRAGKRTLIVVDEAQNLPNSSLEELRMLSNFQLGGRALVQTVLLAQPEFRERLAAPGLEQLRQRVIASHHLEPMGPDEIEAYVRHRMGVAGWNGRPEFAPELFGSLYQASGGIPRRLNQLLGRLLLFGAVERLERIDSAALEAVLSEAEADSAPVEPKAQVLPLRTQREPELEAEPELVQAAQPASAPEPISAAAEARIAALEARLDEQDAAIRRVLALLVEWAEQDRVPQRPADRRFHAV